MVAQLADVERHLHLDVEHSTVTLQSNMSRVELQVVDLQRVHDQRFADLHKDLAGIVWEVRNALSNPVSQTPHMSIQGALHRNSSVCSSVQPPRQQ